MDKVLLAKDIAVLEDILRENNLTQSQLADKVGCTRQEISFVMKGRRRLSGKVLECVRKHYSDYFKSSSDSVVYNVTQLPYYSKVFLPLDDNLPEKPDGLLTLDKQLFDINTPINIKLSSCAIVGISDDSLSPMYEKGDRVVIDLSKTEFINNQMFCFKLDGVGYVRQITLLPNKIKCTSTKREDTFYITKADNPIVLGLILPRIRF